MSKKGEASIHDTGEPEARLVFTAEDIKRFLRSSYLRSETEKRENS